MEERRIEAGTERGTLRPRGKHFRNGKRIASAIYSGRRKRESEATWQQG
jgi:hypothetical protein